ncbi:RidA family protein [Burkholderia sp. Ac-20379]|uniref:RidA family protein n=1 Tax=Burkholderia sp. Ac-20379 TaxID=2703900 RepID=UPI001980C512|nr:RidA family protein [Burkholderia sp. Ac-20379]MBN3726181.1 RidA family protein [Burkholderia sp. Ac-20379]
MTPDLAHRLARLGLALPEAPAPRGAYERVVIHDDLAYVSGQVCRIDGGVIAGPASDTTPPETIRHAAHTCVLRALAALKAEMPASHGFDRTLFLRGFVHAAAGFAYHGRVLDEASTLLHALFGARGRHARSAVGVAGLPDGALLEIELVVALARRPGDGHIEPAGRNTSRPA